MLDKKKLLICGATGFVGRNLAEHFSQQDGFEVFSIYHRRPTFECSGLQWIYADLTRSEDVERCIRGMDIIVQAAATTSGSKDIVNRPYIHVTDNALMNSLIFRASYEHKVSNVVFFSCSVMYPSSLTPLKETDFNADEELHANYYGVGWTKVYLEKMCEFFSRLGPTRYTVLRHSNIYGPHDKFDLEHSHVFGATMTKVLCSTNGKVVVWGEGKEERDLLYMSDLIRFVHLAIEKQDNAFCLCNVGYGRSFSVKDLVQKIITASKKKITIEYDVSQPSIPTRLALDCTKAKKIFDWEPKISLATGIKKTIEWYQSNIVAESLDNK